MYGVDMLKEGVQVYYDSVFQLIVLWGVDFVKVDDFSCLYLQNEFEVGVIWLVIDKMKCKMVFSFLLGEIDI